MRYLVPVDSNGEVGPHFGRADTVAIAEVIDGQLREWQVIEVDWDASHDSGTHGSHHARIVEFLREKAIDGVVARHAGSPMQRTLAAMGLSVHLGAEGQAQAAVLAVATGVAGQ